MRRLLPEGIQFWTWICSISILFAVITLLSGAAVGRIDDVIVLLITTGLVGLAVFCLGGILGRFAAASEEDRQLVEDTVQSEVAAQLSAAREIERAWLRDEMQQQVRKATAGFARPEGSPRSESRWFERVFRGLSAFYRGVPETEDSLAELDGRLSRLEDTMSDAPHDADARRRPISKDADRS